MQATPRRPAHDIAPGRQLIVWRLPTTTRLVPWGPVSRLQTAQIRPRAHESMHFEVVGPDEDHNPYTEDRMVKRYMSMLRESRVVEELRARRRHQRRQDKRKNDRVELLKQKKWERLHPDWQPSTLEEAAGEILAEPFGAFFALGNPSGDPPNQADIFGGYDAFNLQTGAAAAGGYMDAGGYMQGYDAGLAYLGQDWEGGYIGEVGQGGYSNAGGYMYNQQELQELGRSQEGGYLDQSLHAAAQQPQQQLWETGQVQGGYVNQGWYSTPVADGSGHGDAWSFYPPAPANADQTGHMEMGAVGGAYGDQSGYLAQGGDVAHAGQWGGDIQGSSTSQAALIEAAAAAMGDDVGQNQCGGVSQGVDHLGGGLMYSSTSAWQQYPTNDDPGGLAAHGLAEQQQQQCFERVAPAAPADGSASAGSGLDPMAGCDAADTAVHWSLHAEQSVERQEQEQQQGQEEVVFGSQRDVVAEEKDVQPRVLATEHQSEGGSAALQLHQWQQTGVQPVEDLGAGLVSAEDAGVLEEYKRPPRAELEGMAEGQVRYQGHPLTNNKAASSEFERQAAVMKQQLEEYQQQLQEYQQQVLVYKQLVGQYQKQGVAAGAALDESLSLLSSAAATERLEGALAALSPIIGDAADEGGGVDKDWDPLPADVQSLSPASLTSSMAAAVGGPAAADVREGKALEAGAERRVARTRHVLVPAGGSVVAAGGGTRGNEASVAAIAAGFSSGAYVKNSASRRSTRRAFGAGKQPGSNTAGRGAQGSGNDSSVKRSPAGTSRRGGRSGNSSKSRGTVTGSSTQAAAVAGTRDSDSSDISALVHAAQVMSAATQACLEDLQDTQRGSAG